MVDGALVYDKRYSKEDFSRLTKSQRTAIIESQRQHCKSSNSNSSSSTQISAAQQEQLATMVGNAIVAGV